MRWRIYCGKILKMLNMKKIKVRELIERLESIEDKEMEVTYYHGCFYYSVEGMEVKHLSDGKDYFNLY